MASEHSIARYRNLYARLLRLYPKPYRERFGEGMEQTFSDLLRERRDAERGVFAFALWMFVETSAGILRENLGALMARFRPRGMSYALSATALAQALFAVTAMIAFGQYLEISIFNGFFMALWVGSALLFRRATRHGLEVKPTA